MAPDTGKPPILTAAERAITRHPQGCAFCPAELLGLERDANGDPLCQTCPHRGQTTTTPPSR